MTQDLTAAKTGGKMTLRETVARAIASSYGLDPDETAPRSVICGPANERLPNWQAYAEQADAALEAIRAAGPTEAQIEAGAETLCGDDWHLHKGNAAGAFYRDKARACLSAALAAKET